MRVARAAHDDKERESMTTRNHIRLCLTLSAAIAGGAAAAETSVAIGGRLHVDAALYDEDATELGSGTEIRRARLAARGSLERDWKYKLQVDFADGEVELKDAFVEYGGLAPGALKLGQFKVPFSLEELESSNHITFVERAALNVFAPSRRIGVGLFRDQGPLHLGAAVYGQEASDDGGDEGLGVAGRAAYALELADGALVHLGFAALWEEPQSTDSGDDSLRLRARPESHVTDLRLVDTGAVPGVDATVSVGLEAAARLGALHLQSEYVLSTLDTAAGDFDFDGFYVSASWFPGGEIRPYENGVFKRVPATRAWELALRYSTLSLSDAAVRGGEQAVVTLAANYYVTPRFRLMTNYALADVDDGIDGDEEPSLLQFRVALDF